MNEVGGRAHHWHDGVFEFADPGFKRVAPVEEHHFFAAFGYQLVYLFWLEMRSATDDSIFVNLNFLGYAKRDNFIANPNGEAGEFVAFSLGPFEVDVFERRKLARHSKIRLDRCQRTANRAIDAVFGNDDSTLEIEALTQRTLPQANRIWVCQRRELVIEEDLCGVDALKFIGVPVIEAFWIDPPL